MRKVQNYCPIEWHVVLVEQITFCLYHLVLVFLCTLSSVLKFSFDGKVIAKPKFDLRFLFQKLNLCNIQTIWLSY